MLTQGSPPPAGNAAAGVTQVVAGTNISLSPPGGTGVVTVSVAKNAERRLMTFNLWR